MELGITQRPPNSVTQHELLVGYGSVLSQPSETMSTKYWSYEARRAFIGAYVIATL
jgi:hypothetical protein